MAVDCGVVIIGAGPYGLAASAHLRAAGVETRVFGEPMAFWERQMPTGMRLRSPWAASHIAAPNRRLTLEAYQAAARVQFSAPTPLEHFVAYGQWFQRQVAPDLDRRRVLSVEPGDGGFRLALEDGETVRAQRVAIAAGISPFARRPAQFADLPPTLVSHTSEHADLGTFAGRRVIVVGGGQSAIESAALLREGGASEVEVLVRAPSVFIASEPATEPRLGRARRLLDAPSGVGPPILSWLVYFPDLLRLTPRAFKNRLARVCALPGGVPWLRPRVEGLPITTGRSIVQADPHGDALRLTLDDGTERHADHVLLGTGYQIDVTRYDFLGPSLLRSVARANGYPLLRTGLESSVPGLHFLGAPASWSFGPLLRFVAGTGYAARALTAHVRRHQRA